MRGKILREPTKRQSQVALTSATAKQDNDATDEQDIDEHTETATTTTTTANPKSKKYGQKFFVHYTNEKRFRTLKKEMHKVYDEAFRNIPAMNKTMAVATRNRREAKKELIRKRPKQTLLQNRMNKSTYHSKIASPLPYALTNLPISFHSLGQETKKNKRCNRTGETLPTKPAR